jgi:hypothetical protein
MARLVEIPQVQRVVFDLLYVGRLERAAAYLELQNDDAASREQDHVKPSLAATRSRSAPATAGPNAPAASCCRG